MRLSLTARCGKGVVICLVLAVISGTAVLAAADDCKRIPNILILFDASGYMKEKGRYDHFLQQMGFFEQGLPVTADGFFNVGVRHYGLKVGFGCQNTESIMAIQPWDPEKFMNCFPKTVSYGVSSLATGLRGAADDAAAVSGKTAILLIGGGMESCEADPLKITDQIIANNPDLEIHTFQIGSSPDGAFYLKGIAEKGRGTYTSLEGVSSPALWHSWMKKQLVQQCAPSVVPPGGATPKTFGPVQFDKNSFSVRSRDPQVDAANLAALEAVGQFVGQSRSARLVLHGYSDGTGSVKRNLSLSRKRAEAVAQYLAGSYRIPSSQISIIAHGAGEGTQGRVVVFEIFR